MAIGARDIVAPGKDLKRMMEEKVMGCVPDIVICGNGWAPSQHRRIKYNPGSLVDRTARPNFENMQIIRFIEHLACVEYSDAYVCRKVPLWWRRGGCGMLSGCEYGWCGTHTIIHRVHNSPGQPPVTVLPLSFSPPIPRSTPQLPSMDSGPPKLTQRLTRSPATPTPSQATRRPSTESGPAGRYKSSQQTDVAPGHTDLPGLGQWSGAASRTGTTHRNWDRNVVFSKLIAGQVKCWIVIVVLMGSFWNVNSVRSLSFQEDDSILDAYRLETIRRS